MMFKLHPSKIFLLPLTVLALVISVFIIADDNDAAPTSGLAGPSPTVVKPLKALLIAGGCCHDYEHQHRVLYEGIQARANMRVDVVWTRDGSHDPPFDLFKDPDWAKGYDVIFHDECAALAKDDKALTNILNAHKKVPAVHLHCAMHSFRRSENDWQKHIGIKSTRHGPHVPVSVEIVNRKHPIMAGMEDWVTGKEELYNNEEIYDIEPLALGTQTYKKGGKDQTDTAVVVWTNTKFGAPSFSTSMGHFNENVEDPRYLDMITRGALWACGKLGKPAYEVPYTGTNLVTEIAPKPGSKLNPSANPSPNKVIPSGAGTAAKPNVPSGSRLVKLSAKNSQKDRDSWYAMDGDSKTRWCGNGPAMPTWLQVDLNKPTSLSGAEIEWEIPSHWMQYSISTSVDGKDWQTAFDASNNQQTGLRRDSFEAKDIRFLRVNVLKQQNGMWPSLFELRLYQADGKKLPLFPELAAASPVKGGIANRYPKRGNIKPIAHQLSATEEASVLKDVVVPDGFEASLFAPWQMANYPTCVAAAPNGDLYVSSDGNASIGREAGRGRVLRLRDTDKDGRADQVTEFVREIDSPRGLIWDHDRLYLLHPPHITAFHDADGDGIAEASERLISNIAFGFKDRSADHTTNGLEMGIDGWIYVAVGDFGFMNATGTDGRSLQMRGGGVVRFRPDGTGLETFSDGSRNIYGLPISPTLDIFARDNTNDGGGWDVRFHHFTGLEDHGYPRLYMNFPDEIIAPLNDYGGGSGCGGFYIDEPGIPSAWNSKPYTIDWGKVGSFRHDVVAKGASFEEPTTPQRFIKMTRPTDADVDGMSAIYQASWKGPAQFGWKGVNHGYIARVAPKGYQPKPLPDFSNLTDAELVNIIRHSASHVRRLNAQRMLLRRPINEEATQSLLTIVTASEIAISQRVAALYTVSQRGVDSAYSSEVISLLTNALESADDPLWPFVVRAMGDMAIDLRTTKDSSPVTTDFFNLHLKSKQPRVILESIIAAVRQEKSEVGVSIASHLGSADPVLTHTAYRGLAQLGDWQSALPHLDSPDKGTRSAASWALMRMHTSEVVNALIDELKRSQNPEQRRAIISTLARLYHKETPWAGQSWGTRPDTRGPYYELETWASSADILASLNGVLQNDETPADEAAWIVSQMGKNRIQNDASLDRILTLAENDDTLIPTLVNQLSEKSDLPSRALPLVIKAAKFKQSTPGTLKEVVGILLSSDRPEAFAGVFSALTLLKNHPKASPERNSAQSLFIRSPKLENNHETLIKYFNEKMSEPEGHWAAQGILALASKSKSPETREATKAAIDQGWQTRVGKLSLMEAASTVRVPILNDRIRILLNDSDKGVRQRAEATARRLGIQKAGSDTTAKISTLKSEDAIAQATNYTKGNVALGEAIYTKANCGACHTVSQAGKQKGPYLGSIAEIYRRGDLAEAILLPGKTISQGFSTHLFSLKDGKQSMGFVTNEKGDSVTVRDIAGNELTFNKEDIKERQKLPTSMMPPGLMNSFSVHEFASLLDYLKDLSE